jgi:hypothetical protein
MDAAKKKKLMIAGGIVLGLVVLYFLYQMIFGAKTTDKTTDKPADKPSNVSVQPDGSIITRFETKPTRSNGTTTNRFLVTKAQFDGKAALLERDNIRNNPAWIEVITRMMNDPSNIDLGGLDLDSAIKATARIWIAGEGHDGNAFYYNP